MVLKLQNWEMVWHRRDIRDGVEFRRAKNDSHWYWSHWSEEVLVLAPTSAFTHTSSWVVRISDYWNRQNTIEKEFPTEKKAMNFAVSYMKKNSKIYY
jgi:hypothetical protein